MQDNNKKNQNESPEFLGLNDSKKQNTPSPQKSNLVELIFDDSEATRNLVGFFDLALKVHMRIHPELYQQGGDAKKHD